LSVSELYIKAEKYIYKYVPRKSGRGVVHYMIRHCHKADFQTIYEIINDSAKAYRGVIPQHSWREPYMSKNELSREIQEGVIFWGYQQDGKLAGVMGLQEKRDVTLIRHAYVLTKFRKQGIGTNLLRYLERATEKPILIGTWANATWAISFYEKRGYQLVSAVDKDVLLKKYWTVPDAQIETSVVLADATWTKDS